MLNTLIRCACMHSLLSQNYQHNKTRFGYPLIFGIVPPMASVDSVYDDGSK